MAKHDTSEEEHIDMNDDAADDTAEHTTSGHEDKSPDSETPAVKKAGPHHKLWGWIITHKKLSIPTAIVLVVAVLAAIPFTRYFFAGMVIRKDFSVVVTDSQTHKPVTSAAVTIAGVQRLTDNQGKAKIHTNVGSATLSVTKKYYKNASSSVLVAFTQKQPYAVSLEATGRPVPVKVVNKISGQPVADITIAAENTQVITDKKGEATLVVPANKAELKAAVSGKNFNKADVTLKVTATVDPANTFTVTPAGKLYFLSNASGKLDLVKADLDGQNRQTVLAGTGKEEKSNTVLLASRDWKYIALLSKRDGGDNAKLFLIETDSDKLTTMDEGDAIFTPYGWSGGRFVYSVLRTKVNSWQPNRQALKSYNAATKAITVLDQTTATGSPGSYTYESLNEAYILNQEIVYTKNWSSNGMTVGDHQATFNSVQSDGTQKKLIKGYSRPADYYVGIQTKPGDFNEIYIQFYPASGNKNEYDSYEDGKIKTVASYTDDEFYQGTYNTYVVSPSNNKTFWTEYRDGKNVFFVGDGHGANGQKLEGGSEDFATYGWYTDDYILITKKSSELRILPAQGVSGGIEQSLKVTDYYKPNYLIRGYGYGYGG